MPRIKVEQPSAAAIKDNARAFALLHQLDPSSEGTVDASKLTEYADRGDVNKVKSLAGKENVSFNEFVDAFKAAPSEGATNEGNCFGWAAKDSTGEMSPYTFTRRELRPDDVRMQVTYCGMCHSDVHQIRDEWGNSKFPMVPGHEVVGVIVEVGKDVKKFKVGDFAAVGCLVDSCGECDRCKIDEENYCLNGFTPTYNGKHKDGEVTQGGYSTFMVVKDAFTLKIKPSLHRPATAPLLCAGITVYSPMRYYGADKKGQKVAVLGLGGLGHMVVKFAKAFGQHITVLSRSDKKKDFAMNELGADAYIATGSEDAIKEAAESFDAIVDTVSAKHDIQQLLGLLKVDGKLLCVGVPPEPYTVSAAGFVMRRRLIGGSLIGGIKETQEMLDFCAEKDISCDVEVVGADYVNKAVDRIVDGDVKFRFVIDTLKTMIK